MWDYSALLHLMKADHEMGTANSHAAKYENEVHVLMFS